MKHQARLDVPGTLYHIMVRVIENPLIFQDEADQKNFIDRMRHLAKETGLSYYLSRELGIPMAEIAPQVGVRTTAVVMAIKRFEENENLKIELIEQRPFF